MATSQVVSDRVSERALCFLVQVRAVSYSIILIDGSGPSQSDKSATEFQQILSFLILNYRYLVTTGLLKYFL